jgi:TldD protein
MKKSKAQNIIQAGKEHKADFVEIFEEECRSSSVLYKDRKVESAKAGTEYGIGIRLVYGYEVLYGFTSNDDEKHLLSLVDNLAASRGMQRAVVTGAPIDFLEKQIDNRHVIAQDPRKTGQEHKLEIVTHADHAARSYSSEVNQVSVSAADVVSDVLIINSEGLWIRDSRTRSRFSISVTAGDGENIFVAREAPGAMKGFEFFQDLDVDGYAKMAAGRAVLMLSAGYIEGRKMPVIMGNGFGGVIFHEACGHTLETDAIRRKASPFIGKIGHQIANHKVTAVDDGTIANEWGSLNVDDEGTPTQRTVLIKEGVLRSFMSDRVTARELGVPITGSARRESYKYAPLSRMRNTYIAAGKDKIEDMINSVDYGLYAKKMGGGSVNPATGEFNFAVEEGYIIQGGKIRDPVRGATLIGKGHEILPQISMVGDDLDMAAGMCGAASGMVPTTVGQPTLRVGSILVGGH